MNSSKHNIWQFKTISKRIIRRKLKDTSTWVFKVKSFYGFEPDLPRVRKEKILKLDTQIKFYRIKIEYVLRVSCYIFKNITTYLLKFDIIDIFNNNI